MELFPELTYIDGGYFVDACHVAKPVMTGRRDGCASKLNNTLTARAPQYSYSRSVVLLDSPINCILYTHSVANVIV